MKIKDEVVRRIVEDLDKRVKQLESKYETVSRTASVERPVVDPEGKPLLTPIKTEIPEYRWGKPLTESRRLSNVLGWLEELLEVKFQIVRTADEEGGYEGTRTT